VRLDRLLTATKEENIMLVVTNRNIVASNFKNGDGDENGFGEKTNAKGPNELRFAKAEKKGSGWVLHLVAEPKDMTLETVPSRVEFQNLAKRCVAGKKNCLFYVHGYNKPFPETLEQGWLLQERYGLEVVVFSWPSNTGGLPPVEYRQARRIAQASFGAFDSLLEKFSIYLREWQTPMDEASLEKCGVSVNLMTHSLGNYLFEHYVLSAAYQAETRIFTNVILSQADVNSVDHRKWVDKVVAGQRLYVTINENDKTLGWSETLNPPRLGRTLANLTSPNATYFDFTNGSNVGNKHQLWGEVKNSTVKTYFDAVLNGKRGEDIVGFSYDSRLNAFRLL
jgi:esterase/lipase superfamily enzyme